MPKMNVIKSIYVDAAPEKIYPIINDLSNWEQWSPWVIAEPNAQLNVAADGKYHEWDGEIIGAGNLKIKEEVENQSVTMALNFLKPWKSKAITRFALKKKAKGTEVVWTMESSLPFFLFWMKKQMEIFVGMDYERGLTMLKDLVETGSSNSSLNFKGIKTFNATKYVGLKSQCRSSNLGQSMEKDFTQLMEFVRKNGVEKAHGNPLSIYHEFDVMKGKVIYSACHPVKEIPVEIPKNFYVGELPKMNVYTVSHTGPYRHIGNAWSAAMMHQRAKKFKAAKKIPPMEVMLNSPKNTPEKELVAEILFAVK
ncbi:SRPBCC family protein [Flavobacteriaceae bacterium]|nr:SRPBCC family protein [Flavobacteriaceae bacterium]